MGSRYLLAQRFKFLRITAGTWTIPTSWGTIIATTYDITLPAQVGDVLQVSLNGWHQLNTMNRYLDVASVVSGTLTNYYGQGGSTPTGTYLGVGGWRGLNNSSVYNGIAGSIMYTVVAGDLVNGFVTSRIVGKADSGTPVIDVSANQPLFFSVENIGSQKPH